MKLSIVIPAYNEARRLPATLAAISEYLEAAKLSAEVIVVDDGSSDQTAAAVRSMPGRAMPPQVITLPENRGKGAAVKTGLLAARGRYVLFMDADNSTRLDELDTLLPVAESGVPVVIGSRYLHSDSIKIKQPGYRVWLSRWGNRLIRHTILPGVIDTQCGFKLFHQDAARQIATRLSMPRFSFDMELLVIAQQLGYQIVEVPVNWFDAPGTRLRPVKSSLQTLRDLLRIWWNLRRGRYVESSAAKTAEKN